MHLAFRQAQRNLGNTKSNPSVGCVITKNNNIIHCTGIEVIDQLLAVRSHGGILSAVEDQKLLFEKKFVAYQHPQANFLNAEKQWKLYSPNINKYLNRIRHTSEFSLETFQDKLSYKKFRMVLDVDNSEIVIDKKYGTFKYIFEEYHIDDGEMIIEKGFDKIFFQLVNDDGNPLFSLNYKITFD